MPQIPLYEARVAPVAEPVGAPVDPGMAAAESRALAGTGQQVANIGFQFAQKSMETQRKADVAGFENDLRDFGRGLEEAKASSNVPYWEREEAIVRPMLEDCEASGSGK